MTSALDTARLVEQARDRAAPLQQRHAAFSQLVRQCQHLAFALALAMLRDGEEAKDVAQDAFATAWRRLDQLRDPAAFESWLKSVVARQCARRRRRRPPEARHDAAVDQTGSSGLDYQRVVAREVARLSEEDRRITTLFYFLGYTQPQIAEITGLKVGTVAKRLHAARLRIRRGLPPSVRGDFVPVRPTPAFAERVRRGMLDEYVGRYRFDQRPDDVLTIRREDDTLISEASGQRHILVHGSGRSLVTCHYDGEGRFQCDARGRVTGFVYYEFGKRLGVARKLRAEAPE